MFIVKYKGKFGYIKPWTAVRDSETFSQQFLTPSIIEGMEKKIFPELLEQTGIIQKILRHKLQYDAIDMQSEMTHVRGLTKLPGKNLYTHGSYKNGAINFAPLTRGVMLNPVLYLGFGTLEDAQRASTQHLCLCRNEDIVLPKEEILEMTEEEFSALKGYELRFGYNEQAFLVGYNRFDSNRPMYGWIECNGQTLL